ncbi:hypothetical protein [Methylobacterium sp. 77]|uniref:hypothetical protein n=1 Tax=Methylobacterium sp. 77 TaxID=1101192 RepID=UPI0018CA9CEC|nr:hypothetical protein [Methylobacterium sp. 77]
MTNDATRNERLKAALRDNLRRRKVQSRVRAQTDPAPSEQQADEAGTERKPEPEADEHG